jgi:hypothetical protein
MSSLEDSPGASNASDKEVSPNTKEASPDTKEASPDTKEAFPDTKEASPDTKDKPQVNLLDVPINGEVDALNVIVGFLGIAQRRGCFAINESAKIYECVQMFNQNPKS